MDALEAYEWYLERSEPAAKAAIKRSPLMWGNFLWGTRRYLLKKFPYAIVYRLHESEIEIVAVAHGKRKPFWRGRL